MPSIKDQSTVDAIAREFTSNGRRKGEALKEIGYSDAYSVDGGRGCDVVFSNVRVIAAIKAIDDKDVVKMDLSRQAQYKRLLGAYDMAVEQRSPQAIKSVLAEINVMLGYQREAAPNKEKEQALAARMSKEDRELATLSARLRTEQEARAGLKLVEGTDAAKTA